MLKNVRYSLLCFLLFPLLACGAQETPEKYKAGAGQDYEVLATPVRTTNPDKIEVAEAFSYGCSHCFHFEPALTAWLTKLPNDVYFVRVPVAWDNDIRTLHAKMYFTAQQLNKLDTLHGAIFTAMHVDKKSLDDEGSIAKFFNDKGVDSKSFAKTFNSFGVDSLTKQSEAKVRGYNVTGTPTLIVNGKYKIMGGSEKILDVANFLIEKERKAKK